MTVFQVYVPIGIAGALLLMWVVWRAEHDPRGEKDPRWLFYTRRGLYTLTALAALNSVSERMSPLSMLLLVVSAVGVLGITEVVMRYRIPPKTPEIDFSQQSSHVRPWWVTARNRRNW